MPPPAPEPGADQVNPLASILVPVYNGARHLPGFLDRIDHQFQPDMELVLVDDGSDDDTASLFNKFASNSPWRCRVVALSPNGGLGAARRAGFEAASGSFILCLDVDDQLQSGALDAVADALRSQAADEVLVFDFSVRMGGVSTPTQGMVAAAYSEPDEALAALLRADISPYMWNKAIPRHGLVAEDFSARRQGEDLPTLARAFQVHHRVRAVRVTLLEYVVEEGSLSQTGDLVQYTSPSDGQVAEVRKVLIDQQRWDRCHQAFECWYAPMTLANAALSAARRPDGRFGEVRRNVLAQTTAGHALVGARRGARRSSVLLLLLRVAPPVFRQVARSSDRVRRSG